MTKRRFDKTYGLVDYEPRTDLIEWIGNKLYDTNKYYWMEEGHVNGHIRFKLYCEKHPLEVFIEDIDNNHRIEVNYKATGYKRAEAIILSERSCGRGRVILDPIITSKLPKNDKEYELSDIKSKLKLLVKKLKDSNELDRIK